MKETIWEIYLYEEDYGARDMMAQLEIIDRLSSSGLLIHFPVKLVEVRKPCIDDIDWDTHAEGFMEIFRCDVDFQTDEGGPEINITGQQLRDLCAPSLDLENAALVPTGREKIVYDSRETYVKKMGFPKLSRNE